MKRLWIIGLLWVSGTADAVATPIRGLITGSGGQLNIGTHAFIVGKRTSDGSHLNLGVGLYAQVQGRLTSIGLLALKEYLKPSELDLLISNTSRVTRSCFNLLPERMVAISAWLRRQNQTSLRKSTSDFGPIRLRFVRDIDDQGTYYTAVYMSRSGTPGIAPWSNYCTG